MHSEASRRRLAAIAALLVGTLVHAQQRIPLAPMPKAPPDTIERWLAAVNAHVPGQLDGAVTTVASWPDEHLTYTFNLITTAVSVLTHRKFGDAVREDSVRRLGIREPADVPRVLKRGAALHADIAMLAPDLAVRPRPAMRGGPGGSSVLVRDGETVGIEGNPVHWAIGRALVRGLQPTSIAAASDSPSETSIDPFARHWFRATTAYLAHGRLADELPHTQQALITVPDDPVLLLFSGALHEHFGSPVVQGAIRSATLPAGMEINVASASTELNRARDRYERAIALDPTLAEAHIRLGRVLGRRGDHADAVSSLKRGEDLAVDPRWKYFAALFLGHEQEELNRYADAREAYVRAAALYPRAQSPRLGFSRLATEIGDRDAAAASGRALLSLPSDPMARDDPWWSYEIRSQADRDRHLSEYYAIARAGR